MFEKIRKQQTYQSPKEETQVGVLSLPEDLDPMPEQDQEQEQDAGVQVIYGAGVQNLPLAGLQISQARELVQGVFNVDPQSEVLVNGHRVRLNYRIAVGDTVEFVHQAGEKGAGYGCAHRNCG